MISFLSVKPVFLMSVVTVVEKPVVQIRYKQVNILLIQHKLNYSQVGKKKSLVISCRSLHH